MRIQKIILLSISLLFIISCSEKNEDVVVETVKPVKYAIVEYSGGLQTKIFNGISKSGSSTSLSFRANGLILQMNVSVGNKVKKGDLLAKLDQKDISLNYEKAKASLTNAKIQYENAKSNLERIKELYQKNSVSLNEYELAKNNFANSNSSYETAKKSLALESSQFEYTKIIAPTDGIITEKNASINEFAQAGNPIFIMNSEGGDLEVSVGIPEKYISKITNGDEVEVLINDHNLQGIITEVGFSTGGFSTYPITIKLIDPLDDLRPDMPAEITFEFGSVENVSANVVVPIMSIGEDENGHYVFLLTKNDEDNYLVKKQAITIGLLRNNGFEVESGVKENDIVATAGLRTLHDDMVVSLIK